MINTVEAFIEKIRKPINVIVNFLKGESNLPTEVSNETDSEGFTVTRYEGTDFEGHEYDGGKGGGGGGRGFAKGIWTVPYDMTARIHRGEQILTASQARQSDSANDYEYIAGMIGTEIRSAFDRLGVYLYGDKVGDMTSRRVDKNIRARSYAVQRAMGG